MNCCVCLRIRIFPNLMIFRRREKPGLPCVLFSYVPPCSSKQILSVNCRTRNWNPCQNLRCYRTLIQNRNFLFRRIFLQNSSLSLMTIFFRRRGMPHHPYGQFLSVLHGSLLQSLALNFRSLMKMTRPCFRSRNRNRTCRSLNLFLILRLNRLFRLRR